MQLVKDFLIFGGMFLLLCGYLRLDGETSLLRARASAAEARLSATEQEMLQTWARDQYLTDDIDVLNKLIQECHHD